eukprot:499046_1
MMSSTWLKSNDCQTASKSNLIALNDAAFVVAYNENDLGLSKFDTINSKWSQLIKYPNSYISSPKSTQNMLSFDSINYCLYLYTEWLEQENDPMQGMMFCPPTMIGKGKISIVDLEKDDYKTYNILDKKGGHYGNCICINSKCHIISNNKHFILDSDSKTFKTMSSSIPMITIKTRYMISNHPIFNNGLIYLPSKKCLYFFGGRITGQCVVSGTRRVTYSDLIWKYSLKKNEWKLFKNVKLPKKMEKFGFCLSKNNKFVYIFGGYDGSSNLDDIYMWNLKKMTFIKSKVKCPTKNEYFAVSIG